jgi:hypothetical protein
MMTKIMAEKMSNPFSRTELKHYSAQTKAHEILSVRLILNATFHPDLRCPDTDQDVDNLIEKTRREAVQDKAGAGSLSFNFAKVWAANKAELEEVVVEDQTDSWAQALQKLNQHKQEGHNKELAESGRGARRRAADIAKVSVHLLPRFICLLSFHAADQNAKFKQ